MSRSNSSFFARTGMMLIGAVLLSAVAQGQVSISGTTCTVAGGVSGYQYTISGAWQPTDNVTWTITGGVIAGTNNTSKSGTVGSIGPRIFVVWNPGASGANLQLYESQLGNTSLSVTVITINSTLTPASQNVTYGSSATITGGGPSSGCSPAYSFWWESSASSTGPFSTVSGATGQSLTINNVTQTTYYRRALSFNGDVVYSNIASVNIPPFSAGSISTSNSAVNYNTQPSISQTPASGGYCSSPIYEWQRSVDGGLWQPIGTGAAYPTGAPALVGGTLIRRKAVCTNQVLFSNTLTFTINYTSPNTEVYNYIRVSDVTIAGVVGFAQEDQLPIGQRQQSTQYFDGLGKVVETVSRQSTPLQKDYVTPAVYDNFGREVQKYLPYASAASDGKYKSSPLTEQNSFNGAQFPGEQYYYAQTGFENSPLQRIDNVYAPGLHWVGNSRGVGMQYGVNTLAGDSVQMWRISLSSDSLPYRTGVYGDGLLYKTITTDEQNHQVIEYKNMDGEVILKKVQSASSPGTAHVGWLCTYYIYDDLGNLRFVLQPRATELINGSWTITAPIAAELCFRYVYDQRNRMVIKKIPGAGEVHQVFDARDRLVMTQDSNLRSQHQWLFTCYDALNRGDSTGLMTDSANYNNLSFHTVAAMQSATYPNVSSYRVQLMTRNFYDDYTWVAATSAPVLSAFDTSHSGSSSWFITSYNASPTYAVAMTPCYNTRGMQTGVAKNVIASTNNFMYTSMFYDDRGRLIQTSSNNFGLGKDTVTNQYNFAGKPLRSLHGQSVAVNTGQSHMILTQMDYDQVNRLSHIYKVIDNPSSLQLISNMQYNELGQLNVKYLGNSVDSLIYSYNIRGWLTGINKNYVGGTTNHWFGMELAYDNATSVTGATYATPAFNGNIAGVIWKSRGDGIDRKYDFTYDNVNRLTGADFNQYVGGAWGKSSGGNSPVTIDFSVSGLGYDANGNILSMIQQGFKIGGTGTPIDSLTYTYASNSNKLLQVHDEYNDTASVLGDFHYKGTKGSTDYSYDGDGNIAKDNNRNIAAFYYNYLNLLGYVHMVGKGIINYVYDAGGTKLQKQVKDSTTSTVTYTSYLGEFQYITRAPFSAPYGGSDTLQFITTEEGRARWAFHKHVAGDTITYPEYDFVERDHLGNERVLLTQERDTTQYIATMEAANRATENALFYNIGTTCVARTSVPAPGYPDDLSYTPINDSVVKLNGNGPTVGPAIILKVMAGDSVDVGTQFYYNTGTYTSSPPISAQNLLNSLASGLATISSAAGENITTLTNPTSSPLLAALTSSINNNDTATGTSKPQAYLNWVLLDKQFRYVAGSSGAMQVGAAGQNGGKLQPPLIERNIPMSQSGYLYIYVSNATKGWDVFFDNMIVHLYSRQLLEENHFYPFGLTMAGISDKAIKAQYAENKYRFNMGTELQNKEFSDGTGLELYDAHHRMYDPQLGRFGQLDPLADAMPYYSPYSFASNDPISHVDPFGLEDSVVTTKTTNLAPAYVYGHKAQAVNYINWPQSTSADRKTWAGNQGTYYDRLNNNRPLSQKGDPTSYTASLGMYKRWTQEDKNYRAMQSWAVGIIAAPALAGAAPEAIAYGLDFTIKEHISAAVVDVTIQTIGNGIEGKDPIANFNFASTTAALLIGAPAGASLQNVIGVNALNATIGTSLNLSAASLQGHAPVLSFNPLSILIGTVFGTAGMKVSGTIGGGNLGDGLVAPINVTGQAIDSDTKPKEQ